MVDRQRLQQTVQPQFGKEPDQGNDSAFLRGLLKATFQQLSNGISGGGDRIPPLGASDAAAEGFIPNSVDPDLFDPNDGEEFVPTLPDNLPDAPFEPSSSNPDRPVFDMSTLPSGGDGKFFRTDSGKIVFSRGVGEAPDNKAHKSLPVYQARAEFVTGALSYVTSNFDVSSAGQFRDEDAEVSANRSHNSDHYSGGAFDVRAANPAEAQRVLAWAAQQPWVSFAQVYPDGTLIHISANIAAFGEGPPTSIDPPAPPDLTVDTPEPEGPPSIDVGRPS